MDFGPVIVCSSPSPMTKLVVLTLFALSIYSLWLTLAWLLRFRQLRSNYTAFLASSRQLSGEEPEGRFEESRLVQQVGAALRQLQKDLASPPKAGDPVIEARSAIERAVLLTFSELGRGPGTLRAIALIAPAIGLLGTVASLIAILQGVAYTGSAGIGALSVGIAEALVTTQLALWLAIPAAWLGFWLRRRLELFRVEVVVSSAELVAEVVRRPGSDQAPGTS